jgi:hypothetical protein
MQQKHPAGPQVHQQQASKVPQTHLPQQPTAKLQTIISKPGPMPQKPVQVPLKQANQPVPVKTEAVQPPQQQLPSVPARKTSLTQPVLPPSTSTVSEPPKVKAPQLVESTKRAQSIAVSSRGPPPPIPVRSGSVQYPMVPSQQTRPMRRQSTINSAMPACTPQPPPEFYIPQRRGSITRQPSSSSVTSVSSPSKLSK